MTTEEYQKLCQYNITRYLADCHKNKKEASMEFMATVNFNEVSSKEVVYHSDKGERFPININETLAQNCIGNLPFEAYDKFVTADWINSTKDYDGNLVGLIITRRNLPLLEKLHDLGLKKALEDRDYSNDYTRKFLQNVVNVTVVLNDRYGNNPINEEEFSVAYLKLVKKCVCEIDFFYQMNFAGQEKKILKHLKNPDWTKVAAGRYSSNNYRSSPEKSLNQLFVTLGSQPNLNPIFQDAFVHVLKRNPKTIRNILGLDPSSKKEDQEELENILSIAFNTKNFIVAKTLVDTFGLSQDYCLKAYEHNIAESLSKIGNYSEHGVDVTLKNYFNKDYQLIKNEFFPELETQYIPLFILGKDKILKSQLLEKQKNIFNQNVTSKDKFSINDCIFLAKTLNMATEIMSGEGKKLSFRDDRDSNSRKNLYIHIAEYIIKSEKDLMNTINFKTMSTKHWNKVAEKMDDFVYLLKIQQNAKSLTLNIDEIKTIMHAAKLNGQLDNSSGNTSKGNKLKI